MSPRYRTKPIPPNLRHVIVQTASGFELRTCWGYVLKAFARIEDARAYYAWHCPADFGE